ncbi:MAG: thiamine pyrophosphate-dependent dehydrogenase E1 component subunit alpha [Candidatus Lernaella stagnicola]|nr:thiamine pyrophosphate-dependent dehydrogenase E1 component subunit alpha [Candidatus Lernaella stagnicola]
MTLPPFPEHVAAALGSLALREKLLAGMVLVRRFEERVLELFSAGELFGTTHCAIGQEADAVAVIDHLRETDLVFSNHRCHGHYLIRTGDALGLFAELMGRRGGVCDGRGGSQHLCTGRFFTNGVQGNLTPVAAGAAYAEKVKKSGAIGVLFLGDGTFGEGVVYETFNLLSLWQVPLLVVVENNRYAQTTSVEANFAGSFVARAAAFALSAGETTSRDAEELHRHFAPLVRMVREEQQPHVEVVHTYRYCAHSKGDDHRSAAEIDAWRATDPLNRLAEEVGAATAARIEAGVAEYLRQCEDAARALPFPSLEAADG